MAALASAFFVTALLYASVGFGGGSTYSALLALVGFDYRLLPILSLCCNIIVVTGGTLRFARAGVLPWRNALVLSLLAAPMAVLGGLTPISEIAFLMVLGAALVFTGLALIVPGRPEPVSTPAFMSRYIGFAATPLGYLAGLVGIGGGIFLAPLLHLTRWAPPRQIAATASLFILINSLAGLGGQLAKNGPGQFADALTGSLPLLLAVVVGGQMGSILALRVLSVRVIRWCTAVLTIWAGSRLLLAI